MRLTSTGPTREETDFRTALFRGLARDGGLYQPELPDPLDPLQLLEGWDGEIASLALPVVRRLLGDEVPEETLHRIVSESLDFPVPLVEVEEGVRVLELFHGPTLAFKDVGARFMARAMKHLNPDPSAKRTVLVATSGDTGAAVADAFHGLPGFRVVVLFPRSRVSEVQRRLFTTLEGNVTAVEVSGTFDDCQRMAKEAFGSPALREAAGLTSANSINVGRLLPQTLYYFHAWAQLPDPERASPVVSVPSGNLGNLTAGVLARLLGLPLERLVGSTNLNDALGRYLDSGNHRPRPVHSTLSNAMDVADPSNLARLRSLAGDDPARLGEWVASSRHDDEETLRCMRSVHRDAGYLLDPHGAVGYLGLRRFLDEEGRRDDRGVVLATAHPAKFPGVVERAVGEAPELPPALRASLDASEAVVSCSPRLEELEEVLRS